MTAEAWIYPTVSRGDNQAIVAHWQTTASNLASYELYLDTNGKLAFAVVGGAAGLMNGSSITSSGAVPLNQWTHVAGVYNAQAGRLTVYVGGAIAATAALTLVPAQVVQLASVPLTVGRLPAGAAQEQPFQGYIDEVRVSSVTRYTAGFTPAATLGADAQTIVLYHFDEPSGTTAHDASSHASDGTLAQNAQFATPPKCQ